VIPLKEEKVKAAGRLHLPCPQVLLGNARIVFSTQGRDGNGKRGGGPLPVGLKGVEIVSQDPQGGPKQLGVPLHFWREPSVAAANLHQELHIAQKVLGRFTLVSRRGSDGREEEVERERLPALSELTSKLEGDSPPHAVPEYHQRNLFDSSQGISDGFYIIQKSVRDGFRIAALAPRSHHGPELYPPGEGHVPDMEEPRAGTGGRDGQETKLSPRTWGSADQPPVSGDDQRSSPPGAKRDGEAP
jgi:hypothetical protein